MKMKLAAIGTMSFLLIAGRLSGQEQFRPAKVGHPPKIDGALEEIWQEGRMPTTFRQIEPAFGAPATVRSEVFVVYDATHVYFAARLWQPGSTIRSAAGRRDSPELISADFITFVLDPQLNGNAAYFFTINPAGSIADGVLDSSAAWTRDWDGVVTHAVSVSDESWVVELSLPVSTLSFQRKRVQDWGFLVERRYAEGQELDLSSLTDEHHPYRIDTFARLTGLSELSAATKVTATPYAYAAYDARHPAADDGSLSPKAGIDVRLTPTPSLTILGTVRPDYAQLESDAEIINVSDVPTSYPEKRPFFTESSDLYPGLAVNTRNITDIAAGVKMRQVLSNVRYDATVLRDRAGATWLLGDTRWTNNRTYHVEVIGGLKDLDGRRDYNVTTNLRTWWLDKRLTAFTWFGTINQPRRPNEFESVNAVRWLSRTVDAGVWSHVKSSLYNPNIVGHNTLSNEIIVSVFAGKAVIWNEGWLRRLRQKLNMDQYWLYSRRDSGYTVWSAQVETEIHPSDFVGNWTLSATYQPRTFQRFRYRNTASPVEPLPDTDAFGPFVLEDQRRARAGLALQSDTGKRISARAGIDTPPVRGSKSRSATLGLSMRLSRASTASYDVESVHIDESPWQRASDLTIHRMRLEHSIGRALNIRAIVQNKGTTTLFADAGAESRSPTFNLALVWRHDPNTSVYCVYNDSRSSDRSWSGARSTSESRSVVFKLARSFRF